jgi:hypothetical protein
MSVSRASQKELPVSCRWQLLLLWCYACSLIHVGRRVRSNAQHPDGAKRSKLYFICVTTQQQGQTTRSTPSRKTSFLLEVLPQSFLLYLRKEGSLTPSGIAPHFSVVQSVAQSKMLVQIATYKREFRLPPLEAA